MKRDKDKQLIKESILFAIDSIKEDICETNDEDRNLKRAQAIRLLAAAWKEVNDNG